jgi:protein-S-isoprenylcysteine O-methyltransferase Ste14
MKISSVLRRMSRLMFIQFVHAFLLLLPTLVLARSQAIEPAVACFTIGIMLAALLESVFASQHAFAGHLPVRDKVAMRVAALVGVSMLAAFWIAQIERQFTHVSSHGIHAIGAIALALGVGLRVVAIRTLGPRFVSDIRVDSFVVRDGIYAWLRHPSEVGLLLIVAGGTLVLGAPITATVATIVLIPVSRWRMHREDLALSSL